MRAVQVEVRKIEADPDSLFEKKHSEDFNLSERSLFSMYMNDVSQDPPIIELEEQLEFGKRIDRRDKEAITEFIERNTKLVVSQAKKFKARNSSVKNVDLLDIIQEGNKGLMKYVPRYDYRKGFKFSSFAFSGIRRAMQLGIGKINRTIRTPLKFEKELSRVLTIIIEHKNEFDETPSFEYIATLANFTVDKVKTLLHAAKACSLDQELTYSDSDFSLYDIVEDPDYDFDRITEKALLNDSLVSYMDSDTSLDNQERTVIFTRFGLLDGEYKTLEATGKLMGLCRERIRQVQDSALDKLKKSSEFEKKFLDFYIDS
tara:strand:- start:2825 stop:3772 length:948 start_codon:yes stop_codon:yes gene_type:complete